MIFTNQQKKPTDSVNNSKIPLEKNTSQCTHEVCLFGTRNHFQTWAQTFAGFLLIGSLILLVDAGFSLCANTNRSYSGAVGKEVKTFFFCGKLWIMAEVNKGIFDGSKCLLGISLSLLVFLWVHKDNSVLLLSWLIGQGIHVVAAVMVIWLVAAVNAFAIDASSISTVATTFLYVVFQIVCFFFILAYRSEWNREHRGITKNFISLEQEQIAVQQRNGEENV